MNSITEFSVAVCDELRSALVQVSEEQVQIFMAQLRAREKKQIFIFGAGRCQYMLRAFCMRLMHIGYAAYMVGDTSSPCINAGDLCVIADGAGGLTTIAEVARLAKSHGAEVAFLTIVPNSLIGSYADYVVKIPGRTSAGGGYGSSIQPGGGKFEQSLLILLDSIIAAMVDELGLDKEAAFERHANLE